MRTNSAWLVVGVVALMACGGGVTSPGDGGQPALDAGGLPIIDGGSDGGPAVDAGTGDAGAGDAGSNDAGSNETDAGVVDAGEVFDAGELPVQVIADAGVVCPLGQRVCGDAGACVDLATDGLHCGSCGRVCQTTNVLGAGCFGGQCQISACTPGFANLNGSTSDGCEAQQDLAMSVSASTVTLNAGGNASVMVSLDRINGFPYPVSLNAADLPASVTVSGQALSLESVLPVYLFAQGTATPGTYPIRIVAAATVSSTSVVREQAVSLVVTSSPAVVTTVTASDGMGPLPMNQARQGAGTVTLALSGSGLLAATAASLEEFPLTPVAGGTDTARSYTVSIPANANVPGDTRALTLTLTTASGVTTSSNALTLTPITVATTGNDTGRGTKADPLATRTAAYAVAGVGSRIVLQGGVYASETWATAAPAGLASIGRAAGSTAPVIFRCAPSGMSTGAGIRLLGNTQLRDLRFENCGVGVEFTPTVTQATLVRVNIANASTNIINPPGLQLTWNGGGFQGGGRPLFNGGSATFINFELVGSSIHGTNATLSLIGLNAHDINGTAVSFGAAPGSMVAGRFSAITGVAIEAIGGATVTLDDVQVADSMAVALKVASSTVQVAGSYFVRNTGSAVVDVGGATSVLTFAAPRSFLTSNSTVGVHLQPSTGATVTANLGAVDIFESTTGVLVDNPVAGDTVVLSANGTHLRNNTVAGLRIVGGATTGGTTNLVSATDLTLVNASPSATLVELGAGTGTLSFSSGTWDVPEGKGLMVTTHSRHGVAVGTGSRTVTVRMTGHPYDFQFGVHDDRSSSTPVTPLSVRAVFVGVDGVARSWSGLISSVTGSYSSSVSPRDLASWFINRSGRIDFGAP